MDGYVETFDVEGLEEDLGCLFPVLWRVKRGFGLENSINPVYKMKEEERTHEEKVVILRFGSEVLEDALLQ